MQLSEITALVISGLALIVSSITAYKTFWAKFRGRIWFSNRIVLAHIDDIPSLGLACFFENSGAQPGILDDLRARVVPKDSGTSYYFYPILMRNDYSIFKAYSEGDWFPFSMISLQPNYRVEKYLLLKPQNDKFIAITGDLDISLEIRWYGRSDWIIIPPTLSFSITQEVVSRWNDPKTSAIQITSNSMMGNRRT